MIIVLVLMWIFAPSIGYGQLEHEIEPRQERLPLGHSSPIRAAVEMNHFHFSKLDQDSLKSSEENSLQIRARLGVRFWKDQGELFGVIGAIKKNDYQRLIQKRSYIELSFYPSISHWLQIHQYNVVHLPFSDDGYNQDYSDPQQQGSIYTIGIAPTLRWKHRHDGIGLDLFAGFDIWSRLYSRDQSVEPDQVADEDLGLFLESEPLIEDKADIYGAIMAGISIYPAYLRRASLSLKAYLVNRQVPHYERKNDLWESRYRVLKSSYYQVKAKYALSEDWVIANESYFFYSDYFGEKVDRIGRRLRNIIRLTYHFRG